MLSVDGTELYRSVSSLLPSALSLMQNMTQTRVQAQALALKNGFVMGQYRAIGEKFREEAGLRHKISRQIVVLGAMCRSGDMEGVARGLEHRKEKSTRAARMTFTQHVASNSIL